MFYEYGNRSIGRTFHGYQSVLGWAVLAARAAGEQIGRILGARHGIAGILAGDYLDLRKVDEKKLLAVAATPSSALGSCRLKPTADDCRKIFEEFKRRKVGYFFYIGGNDSILRQILLNGIANLLGIKVLIVEIVL